jgi:hypothetical protein
MARSTDTSTHWSNPQLTSDFLPIKMAEDWLGQLRSHGINRILDLPALCCLLAGFL